MSLPNHLGGHCNRTHTDEATLDFLIAKYNVKTMHDVGCGPGGMVELALTRGVDATGIDGDFTLKFREGFPLILHDFTVGPLSVRPADLGWSVEFLEHVDEKYIDNYFPVFAQCKTVCCTFATNDKGHHHVNVKDQEYWDRQFTNRGFIKDEVSTAWIRKHSSMQREFIRNTGTVYSITRVI